MKNQSSEFRLFAEALNYAAKIARGDPEYTLERAEKIFPPRYFAMVAKEYSNLMELDKYAKTRRIFLTKASWSYQYAADYLQLADKQLNDLREFKKNWQDVMNKQDGDDRDYKKIMEMSRKLDKSIAKLGTAQNKLKNWLSETGLLQNTASINKVIEIAAKEADVIIYLTVGIKAALIDQLHRLFNKGD